MKSLLPRNSFLTTIFLLSFLIIFTYTGYSQALRYIGYGGIYTGFQDDGSGMWEHNFSYPQGWFRYKIFPSELRYIPGGMARKFGVTVGVKNFTDASGTSHPYFLSAPGNNDMTFNVGDGTGQPVYLKKIMKRPLPTINVNGHSITYPPESWHLFQLGNSFKVDSIDPNLPADEELIARYNYSCGITETIHIFAYWDKDYSRILVYHYNFKNTGNVNADSKIELPGQNLQGVVFNWGYWPHLSWEGGIEVSGIYQNVDQNDNWWSYYGANYKSYVGTGTPLNPAGNMSDDSLRVQMWWDGNNGQHYTDNTGDPEVPIAQQTMAEKNPYVGQLLSSQYVGYGFLSAPVSTSDTTNDLSEPKTTTWMAYTQRPKIPPFKPEAMQAWYNIIGSQQHALSPQDSGYTDPGQNGAIYGYSSLGPYNMPFGSQINATMVVGIYGMSYADQIKYGEEYVNGKLSDSQKDALLAKGRDSLLATIGRYTRRYFTNLSQKKNPFSIPSPPPSPDITITSKAKSISESWSSEPNASSYKLYRASGNAHMLIFKKIWEGSATSYEDTAVKSGIPYYYAVEAVDDGSQNWDVPGERLASSFYANRTTGYPATLKMQLNNVLPVNNDTVSSKDTIKFAANVTGGLAPFHYKWTSNIEGVLSDSLSFNIDTLLAGIHTIHFTATDSLGTTVQDSIRLIVQGPINASILSPMNNDTVSTADTVKFSARVNGGIMPYKYKWTSNMQGQLSDSLSFKIDTLKEGIQEIYFSAMDNLGSTVKDSIRLVVQGQVYASILSPADNDTVTTSDTVEFKATVSGGIMPYKYKWTSSLGGFLSDSLTFKKDSLMTGSQTIYFTAMDSLGSMTKDSVSIVVKKITGIENNISEVPTAYSMDQNYPNPFNPSTTIRYSIPNVSKVKIDIYNVLGEKVRELVNTVKSPGYYNVTWDGTNSAGAKVPSGMYIYRITAKSTGKSSSFTKSKKMILLK